MDRNEFNKIGSNGIITGLFTLDTESSPPCLYVDDAMKQLVEVPLNTTPQEAYNIWISRISKDDHATLLEDLKKAGDKKSMKGELKYQWHHSTLGTLNFNCSCVLQKGKNGGYTMNGYYRVQLSGDGMEQDENDKLLRNMLSETMLDSFCVCGVCDIKANRVKLINDMFSVGKVLGSSFTYDTWQQTVAGLVFRDDMEAFAECSSRDALLEQFSGGVNDMQGEFRLLNPKTRKYAWMKMRIVKLERPLTDRYSEFFVFRDISESQNANYKQRMRMSLINGLALPYQELDLINLKTGRFYSSRAGEGKYAEDFDECGYFDDAAARFTYSCECTREERNDFLDRFSTVKLAEQFAAGEKIIETEIRRRTRTGASEWVRVQAFLCSVDSDGVPSMAILTVLPITAEKEQRIAREQQLEKALRSERQYKNAILSSAVAVYTYNVTTNTIYDETLDKGVSALLPFLGLQVPCSYDEYVVRKSKMFTSEQEAEAFRKSFNRNALLEMYENKRYAFDGEYEFLASGKKGIFRESVILTQDLETGEIWGLSYVRNVTTEWEKSRRIEQTLRDAFNQAQRANNAKTLFMSQMSHDIRTPLNSILGMAAIAREHIDDSERLTDCMDKIDYSGRHLLELINNVLDLSAIESGKAVLNIEEFDIRQFLEETLDAIRGVVERKKHTRIRQIDDNVRGIVKGDRIKLRQVINNIIGNALKYTPDGGTIRFAAVDAEPDRHDFAKYVFTVEDNGIGMPPEFIEKMFDPFTRMDDQRTTRVEGTGLGMSIALNLVQMMNGDIQVHSEVGKGSVFEITVCLKRGDAETYQDIGSISLEEPIKARMSDYDFGGVRVLLAEDLEFNAEIATEFFSEAGIVAEVAINGAEAVRMFNESEEGYYRMVFMDIQMPELDGNEAAMAIRALDRPDAKTVPILAMTANAFVEDVIKAERSGMNGHIAKPIEIAQLLAQLRRFLGDCRRNK